MANHAILSASSSHRWLNCPPSARLCEAYEDKGSDYAAEGTTLMPYASFDLSRHSAFRLRTQSKISPGTTRRWRTVPPDMPPM